MELFYPLNNEHRSCSSCKENTDTTQYYDAKKDSNSKNDNDDNYEKKVVLKPTNEIHNYTQNKTKPMELPPKHKPPKCDSCNKKIDGNDYPKYAVSSKALACCLDKLTYIWQNDGKEYWTYIFYLDQVCFVGWRWEEHVNDWVYFGIDISKIIAFSCKR